MEATRICYIKSSDLQVLHSVQVSETIISIWNTCFESNHFSFQIQLLIVFKEVRCDTYNEYDNIAWSKEIKNTNTWHFQGTVLLHIDNFDRCFPKTQGICKLIVTTQYIPLGLKYCNEIYMCGRILALTRSVAPVLRKLEENIGRKCYSALI